MTREEVLAYFKKRLRWPRCEEEGAKAVWSVKQRPLDTIATQSSETWHSHSVKFTAILEPAEEGGYTCFVEEIPAAISQGETLAEAKANLIDALKLVLDVQRELAARDLSPNAVRESIELVET